MQDVVYGVWKAKEEGLVGFRDFRLDECVATIQSAMPMLMNN